MQNDPLDPAGRHEALTNIGLRKNCKSLGLDSIVNTALKRLRDISVEMTLSYHPAAGR